VRLSLDLALQQAADAALGSRDGAVVVMQTDTGELLALASHPTYDANALDTTWSNLVDDPRSPLLNRATLGLYQPGRALTPALLTSALASGAAELDQPVTDFDLDVRLNDQTYACREVPIEADVNLGVALADGCPAPLAALGARLGGPALHDLFATLRFFEPPAIGLAVGAASADAAVTDPALAALGQNGLAVSPLQLTLVTAAIAEHGRMPAPRLVLETQDRAGEWQPEAAGGDVATVFPSSAADAVAAWMADGYAAQAASGTSQQPLAWFLAFAPEDDARYAVVVLLEAGDVDAAEAVGRAVLEALR
jgi:peptidoglycan glycosyltransferase